MTKQAMIDKYKKGLPIKSIIDQHKDDLTTNRNYMNNYREQKKMTVREATKKASEEVYDVLRHYYINNISPKEEG